MGNQALTTMQNGVKMPMVGLGTWQTDDEETARVALETALDEGYRLIDTAHCYGNEELIGKVLKEYLSRPEKKLKREDIFVTTKIWPTHLHPDRQESSIRESLQRLQLDHVDLLLAHMPTTLKSDGVTQDHTVTVEAIWEGMEKLYEKGLTRAIGVSNWSISQMQRVLKSGKVPIHNCQVEIYLYWPQKELVDFCHANKITVTSYGSLGSPGRKVETLPNGQKMVWADCPNPLEDSFVVELSKKYHKTPAQILLRNLLERDIAVIPKSSNPKRLKENIDFFDFKLTEEEMEKLAAVKHRQRLFQQHHMIGHPEDGFASER